MMGFTNTKYNKSGFNWLLLLLVTSVLTGCGGKITVSYSKLKAGSFNSDFLSAISSQISASSNIIVNGDDTLSLDNTAGSDNKLTLIPGINLSNLVAYWTLDGTTDALIANGSSFTDHSGNLNHMISFDTDTSMFNRLAKSAQGIEFDGVQDRLTAPNSATLNITGTQLSMMLWMKMPTGFVDNDSGLLCKGDMITNTQQQYFFSTDGSDNFSFRIHTADGNFEMRNVGTFDRDEWAHIAGTYDGANMLFYLNGKKVATMAATGSIVASNSVTYIGTRCDLTLNREFQGVIDDVSVWSRVLDESEILKIFKTQNHLRGEFTSKVHDSIESKNWTILEFETESPTAKALPANRASETDYESDNISMVGVIQQFNFDEVALSTSFSDTSTLSNNGSCGTCPTSGGSGLINNALSFNGTDQFVEVAHGNQFETDEGTIVMWIYPEDMLITDEQSFLSKDSLGFDNGGHFNFETFSSYRLSFRVQSTTAHHIATSSTFTVLSNEWQQVVGSFGPAGVKLYHNGSVVATDPYTGGLDSASSGGLGGNMEPFAIGAGTFLSDDLLVTPLDKFYRGKIDELSFWPQQLTDPEVQTLFKRGSRKTKIKIRTCTLADCSDDPPFVGPDGTSNTYFSEHLNSSTGLPSIDISGVLTPSRYIQYQTILETLDQNDTFKIKSVSIFGD